MPGGLQAERGAGTAPAESGASDEGPSATASDDPAATAKIGATPAATATAQEDDLATGGRAATISGPPAPKAAKQTARRFARGLRRLRGRRGRREGPQGVGQTSTRQLSRSLLHRPPRQPANVKVPKAKVVNVVAGPSKGKVYEVSVSLLRVGVTSELRLQLEQGPGKKWQVTDVLG